MATYHPHPVIEADGPCTVEVISLDGRPTLKVSQAGRYVGYFPTVAAVAAHGVDLAAAIVKGE